MLCEKGLSEETFCCSCQQYNMYDLQQSIVKKNPFNKAFKNTWNNYNKIAIRYFITDFINYKNRCK